MKVKVVAGCVVLTLVWPLLLSTYLGRTLSPYNDFKPVHSRLSTRSHAACSSATIVVVISFRLNAFADPS